MGTPYLSVNMVMYLLKVIWYNPRGGLGKIKWVQGVRGGGGILHGITEVLPTSLDGGAMVKDISVLTRKILRTFIGQTQKADLEEDTLV